MPYYVAAFFAAGAMAWYFFLFVPSKLEYFVGVRLRALAVASSLVKTKAENLASALAKAPRCEPAANDTERYLRVLVPEIQLEKDDAPRPPGLRLIARQRPKCAEASANPAPMQPGDRAGQTGLESTPPAQRAAAAGKTASPSESGLRAMVAWEDVVAQAQAVSRPDFDDLILALPDGEVVWQREETTPRLGNLAQVLYAETPREGWFSFSWNPAPELPKLDAKQLPKAVASKTVSLGGRPSLLLVQAVPMWSEDVELLSPSRAATASAGAAGNANQNERTLYVAGVVSMSALQQQAMHVPVAWVVLLSLPLILLFLALPFVKLATLTARERFSFTDALVLVLATIIIAALAATLPFVATVVEDETDDALAQFAREIELRMAADMRQIIAFGQALPADPGNASSQLEDCVVKAGKFNQKRCNLWAAVSDPTGNVRRGALDLDVVIWVDERGDQVDKWTTKTQLTGETTHRYFQHFQDLTVERLWRLRSPASPATPLAGQRDGVMPTAAAAQQPRFAIEPLRAPTTAELGVIVGFAIDGSPSGSRFLLLNWRPPSLLDAVVPPEYGFAVIAPDGKVVFHSEETRSLQENFFEEVGEPADVRARARSGHAVTWNGDYHGRPHRLHLQQLKEFEGSPWRVVTFRELSPTLADVVAHQSGALRLAAINLALLVAFAGFVVVRSKSNGRDVRDLLNVKPVVQPYCLAGLIALVVFAVAMLLLTYWPPARRLLDATYGFFVVLPLMALGVSAWARHTRPRSPAASNSTWSARALIRSELALLVLLVAALPAAGFARIVDRAQATDRAIRWLEAMQQRIAIRNAQVLARVGGPAYRGGDSTARGQDARSLITAGFAETEDLGRYAYLAFLPLDVDVAWTTSELGADPKEGHRLVRFLLEWNPFPSRDIAGHPPVTALPGRFRLEPLVTGSPPLTIADSAIDRPGSLHEPTQYSLPRAKLLFGMLLLGGTILAVYWARGKLLAYPPADGPTIKEVVPRLSARTNHGVMLIGPPRTRKDREVKVALAAIGARPERRIWLLDTLADREFVDAHLKALAPPAAGAWWRLKPNPTPAAPSRVWVHVSNLETHLVDVERRKLALLLLERLLDSDPLIQPRVIIVTVTVDPVVHFEEIFDEERKGIYEDAVPEVELSRLSLLLTRFRRCYVPIVRDDESEDPWWRYEPTNWRTVLKWETRGAPLTHVRDELTRAWKGRASVSLEELARGVGTRAYALYQLLWTSCTRREKLVLVQLAQEGFVTPQSADVVSALMAKGLIVRRPGPAIFNYTFRAFLRKIERNDVVQEWERGDGHGLWVVAGRLIASSMAAGGLFFLLTQGYSVEALLPVVSGTGVFGVPLVRNLIARFSGGSTGETTA